MRAEKTDWTWELDAQLEKLWDQGLSRMQIAHRMQLPYFAVTSRIYRLGLEGEPKQATWNDKRIEALKSLHGHGHSFSEIARQLTLLPPFNAVTRSAAIGKAARLGLSMQTVPSKITRVSLNVRAAQNGIKAKKPKARKLPTEPIPPPAETDVARKSFFDLADTDCRWIVGDTKPPHEKSFCGLDRVPGEPYCASHCARAYPNKIILVHQAEETEKELETV